MVGVGNNGKDKRLLSPEMAYVGSTLLGRSGDDGVEMMIVAQYPRSGHDPLV